MQDSNPLQYDQIESGLSLLKLEMSPAEAHGLMAGWLCVKPVNEEGWQERLFGEAQLSQQINDIFYFTGMQLESTDFDFQLCLPDDETPRRALCLHGGGTYHPGVGGGQRAHRQGAFPDPHRREKGKRGHGSCRRGSGKDVQACRLH